MKVKDDLLKAGLVEKHQQIAELEAPQTQYRRTQDELTSQITSEIQIVFDSMAELVIFQDRHHRILWVNRAAAESVGTTPEELVGCRCYEVWHQRRPCYGCPVVKARETGKPQEAEITTPDGRTWLMRSNPVRDDKGKVVGVVEVTLEITERKQTEQELKNSEERLRIIFEFAPDTYCLIDTKGNFVDGNRAAELLSGYKKEELIGKNFFKLRLVPPKQFPKAAKILAKNFLGQPTGPDEFTLIRKDGKQVIVEIKTYPVKLQGQTLLLIIVRDITDRKEAEARLNKLYSLQTTEKDIADSLLRVKNEFELFQEVCNLLAKLEFVKLAWIGLADKERCELKPVAHAGFEDGYLSVIKVTWDDSGRGRGPAGAAVMTGQSVVTPDIENDPAYRHWVEEALKRGYASRIVLPILHEGEVIGVLSIYSGTKDAFGDDEVEFLRRIADDIAVGVKTLRLQKDLEHSLESARSMLEGTIEAVVAVSEARDPYTAGHQRRVAKLASAIAEELGLPKEQIEAVRVAGLLHDIGKVYVPAEILSKPGRLSEIEMNLVKSHSQASVDILKTVRFPWSICSFVLQHHERLDGSGYPKGLSGNDISLEAKILGVADVVEAMASHRPYRPALGIDKALEEISRNKGVLYDPEVVVACLRLFTKKEFKFD